MNRYAYFFCKTTVYLLLAFSHFSALLHPLKLSTGVFRETNDYYYVSLKFFSDDFEENLSSIHKKELIFSDGISKKEAKLIEAYIQEKFVVKINDKKSENYNFTIDAIESGLITKINFNCNKPKNKEINRLNISHTGMIEVFSNQKNVLVLTTKSIKDKIEFNANNPNYTVIE